MNTNSPNKFNDASFVTADNKDETPLTKRSRISSYASIEMPKKSQKAEKKTKKAEGAFRTISEVADLLDVQQHVLRFWETKFSQVKPLKRGGGRRYYRPEDVALLQRIHHLLYTEGYTIKGAQKLLKGQSKSQIVAGAQAQKEAENQNQSPAVKFEDAPQAEGSQVAKKGLSQGQKTALEAVLEELKALREAVD